VSPLKLQTNNKSLRPQRREKIGAKIRTARLNKGLSCAELAEKCDVTRGVIYHWERAKYILPKNVRRISVVLKIPHHCLERINQKPKRR
jgi:ribosome-binding protein aMBF1 (putative translation factor)